MRTRLSLVRLVNYRLMLRNGLKNGGFVVLFQQLLLPSGSSFPPVKPKQSGSECTLMGHELWPIFKRISPIAFHARASPISAQFTRLRMTIRLT